MKLVKEKVFRGFKVKYFAERSGDTVSFKVVEFQEGCCPVVNFISVRDTDEAGDYVVAREAGGSGRQIRLPEEFKQLAMEVK